MSLLDEVRQRIDIAQVVSKYVDLDTRSRVPKALCPFHSERTPSFVIYPDSGTWHCFGACATGGDAITFVMKKEGVPFGDALRRLADEFGVDWRAQTGNQRQDSASARNVTDRFEANEVAARYFKSKLKSPEGEIARRYLEGRGIGPEVTVRRGIGLAPAGMDTLSGHLKSQGIDPRAARDAGLVTRLQDGSWRDMFRGRLTIEIRDERGKLCGFGARSLDGSEPKYLNTAKSETFDKGRLLYALNWASDSIKATGRAVVVEGYMDAIAAHEHGFADAVACMGTAITVDQLGLLERYVRGPERPGSIILCLDADAAGQEAMLRELSDVGVAYSAGVKTEGAGQRRTQRPRLAIAVPPGGKDPDEVIRSDSEAWRRALAGAVPFVQFMIEAHAARIDTSTPDGKAQLLDVARPVIASIDNPYEQDRYLTLLANKMDVAEDRIRAMMSRPETRTLSWSRANSRGASQTGLRSRQPARQDGRVAQSQVAAALDAASGDAIEEHLLALVLKHPDLRDFALGASDEHFQDSAHRALFAMWRTMPDFDTEKVPPDDPLTGKIERLISRVLPPSDHLQRVEAVNQCVRRLRERHLRHLKTLEERAFSDLGPQTEPDVRDELRQRALESNSRLRQVFTGRT
jgi:DNA primase